MTSAALTERQELAIGVFSGATIAPDELPWFGALQDMTHPPEFLTTAALAEVLVEHLDRDSDTPEWRAAVETLVRSVVALGAEPTDAIYQAALRLQGAVLAGVMMEREQEPRFYDRAEEARARASAQRTRRLRRQMGGERHDEGGHREMNFERLMNEARSLRPAEADAIAVRRLIEACAPEGLETTLAVAHTAVELIAGCEQPGARARPDLRRARVMALWALP